MDDLAICLIKCKGLLIGMFAGVVHEFFLVYTNIKDFRFRDFFISIFVSSFVGWGAWQALPNETYWIMKTGWTVILSLNAFPVIAIATSKELRTKILERFLPKK